MLKNIVAPRCTGENKSLYVNHIYRLSTFAQCRTSTHKITVQSGTKSGTEKGLETAVFPNLTQRIGLDTNVVLRYLLQDDPKQTRQANKIFDQQLSEQAPGFISLVTVLEIVWVLRSLLKQTPSQVASHLERLLTADSLEIQNEQQVFEAVFAIKRGTGEFEDALIGALNAWAGCSHTLTFDRKAARLPYFHEIV